MIKAFLKRSDFFRNVLTLLTGTTVAQLIPLLMSPVLARLYTPEDFGVYALYVAIVNILVVFATGQYENAILLPEDDRQARSLVVSSVFISLVFSVLSLFVVVLFGPYIEELFNVTLGLLIYLLPLSVFVTALLNIFNYWYVRRENYKRLSKNSVMSSSSNAGISVLLGYSAQGGGGLVVAQLCGVSLAVGFLIREFFTWKERGRIVWGELIDVCVRYKRFPQITIPHGFFSNLSNNLPAIIFTSYFSPAIAGIYFLAFRVSAMPLTVLGNSFYQIFFQQLSRVVDKKRFYREKFWRINLLLIPAFVGIWFLLPVAFRLCFGDDWVEAGRYAQTLLPLLYMKFLSNIFSTAVYIYFERQAEDFMFGVIINVFIVLSLLYGSSVGDVGLALQLMVLSNSAVILLKLIRCQQILEKN